MKELQKSWLAYRDGECMWESENSITPSMKRLNELSCMARLTEDRADILDVVYADGKQVTERKEYGTFPRWMNVLSKDYPDVFWGYGRRTEHDLNCDGEEEQIMQGIVTKLSKTDSENPDEENQKLFSKEVVLAIVENQSIGRPNATILEFPVQQEASLNAVCSDQVSLKVKNFPTEKDTESEKSENTEKACETYLELDTRGCDPIAIVSSGKGFAIKIEETPKTEKKK